MSPFKALVLVPFWFLLVAATTAPTPTPTPSPSPSPSPTPSPSPIPTPTSTHAYIVLDTAAGGPNTKISVSGSSFPPGASVTLYWDNANQAAGSKSADSGGSFTTSVIPFPGSSPGAHKLCGSSEGLNQAPPCANFTLQGAPTPTPPASPSPSSSPTSSPSPTPTPSASPVVLTSNSGRGGFDVIMRPPLVFLPIIALLGLLAALAYWLLMRIDRTPVMPAASVVHRSSRPDIGPMSAPPGTAPAAPPVPEIQPPPPDLPPAPTPQGDDQTGLAPPEPPRPPSY
ncbi:MAG TPA: hypothetical protein VEL12_09910 [Candidatus Nitrosopolaris sp.]|nr:hypothetical protein [Candidatus Nitrosopolaris sp.]